MTHALKDQELSMLRAEVEMLMGERQALLRIVGASAVFIANLDSSVLPEETYEAAELLSKCLNDMPEDTLREALQKVKAELGPGAGIR